MNKFNDFQIKVDLKSFVGDKIRVAKILEKEIVVHAFKIEKSTVDSFIKKGSDKCLHIQISLNDTKYIVFTSSKGLIEGIQQVPKDSFPFTTTIIEENDMYLFT